MKYRVVGWTHWESWDVEDSGSTIGFAERNAIIDDLIKHQYSFSGYEHQEMDCCAPVLNDGKKRTYSQRGWGGVMAEAHGMTEPMDYAAFSFGSGHGSKYPYDEFDPSEFEPEEDLNEEITLAVSDILFGQDTEREFLLPDVHALRYLDRGDHLILTSGEQTARYLISDVGRSRTTKQDEADLGIDTKFKVIVKATRIPTEDRLLPKVRYLYFSVSGSKALQAFAERVGITAYIEVKKGEPLPYGGVADADTLIFGLCEYDGDRLTEQLTEITAPFAEKLDLLHSLREELSLRYYLSIGKRPYGNLYIAPADVDRFIQLSGTVHDLDYNVF